LLLVTPSGGWNWLQMLLRCNYCNWFQPLTSLRLHLLLKLVRFMGRGDAIDRPINETTPRQQAESSLRW